MESGAANTLGLLSGDLFEAALQKAVLIDEIDVRPLDPPLPMTTILEKLEHMKPGETLFVRHKRIPHFLIPELAERQVDFRICVYGDDDVRLLIGGRL